MLQAMLMTDPMDKLDPMSLLLYMSTFSVILLLPTLIILDPGVFGEVTVCKKGTRGIMSDKIQHLRQQQRSFTISLDLSVIAVCTSLT